MFSGLVVGIYVASKAGAPMEPLAEVDAWAGRGLAGDRYATAAGKFSGSRVEDQLRAVTLIEQEAISSVTTQYGIEFSADLTRRNIVVSGVPLNHLVGSEFMVGNVRMRGFDLAEPCTYLEGISGVNVRAALLHRGGLRAEVLTDGHISVSDPVTSV